jgi:hypothetical protein
VENKSRKRFIYGGAFIVVVAAAVAYFAFQYPPSDGEVAGTIGAADRYRAEQITSDDVVVDVTAVSLKRCHRPRLPTR